MVLINRGVAAKIIGCDLRYARFRWAWTHRHCGQRAHAAAAELAAL
jgi:hypothetical protein